MPIPKFIHLVYKESKVPPEYAPYVQTIEKLHPGWRIKIYGDDTCLQIINRYCPSLLPIYYSYATDIQRADVIRILLVYLYGGFYMDMDMLCLKPLDTLCDFSLILGEEKTLQSSDLIQHTYPLRIANYMFGSSPRHPFWLEVLKSAISNCSTPVLTEDDVLDTTGPGMLTDVYHDLKATYRDITLLSNIDHHCLRHCSGYPSCHFGDYAAHMHTGRWRRHFDKTVYTEKISPNILLFNENDIINELKYKAPIHYKYEHLDLYILETYPAQEEPYDGLTGIYNEIKELGTIVNNTYHLKNKKVLVCGIPIHYERFLSPNNTNIIYTTFESDKLPFNWIRSINRYHQCIVPHDYIKKIFLDSGVTIPIHVIHQGFRRYERLKNNARGDGFTVGFLGVPVTRKNLHKLYAACKTLQQSNIPQIKLVIHVATFYNWLDRILFNDMKQDPMVIWTEGKQSDLDISKWYHQLSCYAFPSSGEGWSFTPRESLYLGIPTIISDIPVHRELMESGYCKRIQTTSVERANFNGNYHGNWAFIEIEDIVDSILELYQDYNHYILHATKGAVWMENKWTNADLHQRIIDLVSSL